MATVANYHYVQQYSNHLAIRQQPQSFSNCITGIIKQASSLNPFASLSGGFSFSAALQKLGQAAMTQLKNSLEAAACAAVKNAASGVFGTINQDLNQALNGGIVVKLQATSGIGAVFSTPSIANILNAGATGSNGNGDGDSGDNGDDGDTTIACPDGTVGSTAFGCGDDATGNVTCPDGTQAPANLGCGTNTLGTSGSSGGSSGSTGKTGTTSTPGSGAVGNPEPVPFLPDEQQ